MENKNKIIDNPFDDYQLFQDEDNGNSYFFANTDSYGVEGTSVLENTAKPYVQDEEGNPGSYAFSL